MLKDHYFCLDVSGLTLELESFENDGIALELYFGNGKSLTLDIFDELTEKFSAQYRTICSVLDPFIVEQLEEEVKKCFTK
jgi:hypothetical protein